MFLLSKKTVHLLLIFFLQTSLQAAATPVPVSVVSEKQLDKALIKPSEATLIEVEVIVKATSLFLQVIGQADVHYYFEKVVNPEGKTIVGEVRHGITVSSEDLSSDPFIRLKLSENPIAGPVLSEGAAILIPNRPEVKMIQGKWKFWVRALESNISPHNIQVRSFIKKVSTKIDESIVGVVPINFYFSGAAGLTSRNYSESHYFRVFYKQLQDSLATAGLVPKIQSAEDVTFPKGINLDNMWEVDRSLIAKTQVQPQYNGINLFFTSIRGNLAGVSFGLPGPLARNQFLSGVLVAVPLDHLMSGLPEEALNLKFLRSGYVTAHEIGHYLGLFHICEADSRLLEDGLEDTKCETNSNIMMPGASLAPFSEQQRFVLIRNPIIPLFKRN